jgi:hypothetical protein
MNHRFLDTLRHEMAPLIIRNDTKGIERARRHVDWYFAAIQDGSRAKESGEAQMLFEQVFGALRAYRKPMKLTLTTRESLDILYTHSEWGDRRPRAEEFLSFSKDVFSHGSGSSFVFDIFRAAIAAGNPIRTLEVKIDTIKRTPKSYEDVSLSHESAQALACLERLQVDFGESFLDCMIEKTLVAVVYSARGLVRIVFSSDPLHVKKTYGLAWCIFRLVRVLESHSLRQIWLRDIVMRPGDLLNMLGTHKDTLKELTISNVLLLGSWDEVLWKIKDELRLDTLVMINLSTTGEYGFRTHVPSARIKSSLGGGVELRGSRRVIPGIDEVLNQWIRQRMDPYYEPSWSSAADMGHLAYPED